MRFCLLDFETASACELKKAGAWVYAEHPSTEIICLAYTIDGNKPVVTYGDGLQYFPDNVTRPVDTLEKAVADPGVIFIAHNALFEKRIWREIMVKQYGWPDIPDDRWHDSMASCAMKGLPLSLDRASAVLRLAVQKDTEGRKITLAFSKTNRKGYYERDPVKLKRAYSYCIEDVRGELELHRRVRGLGEAERRVWLLDQKINARGVRLDMEFVEKAQAVCDQATLPLRKEFEKLTGIEKTGSPKFLEWLQAQGANIPNLQKETISKYLGVTNDEEDEDSLAGDEEDSEASDGELLLPDHCRRPLEIRRILGSASIKKLVAMRACVAVDGRAHGLLQYHGAGPGRWAGRLLQPQNFPRPTLKFFTGFKDDGAEEWEGHKPEELVAAIKSGDAERVRREFGEPIEAVANGLRHALIASPGNLLEVGDFAQIEARIVLALAGQHDKTALMAAGQNPYVPMAEEIFHRPINKKVDVFEYTIGKNTILGCGFQMGAATFQRRYCPKETIEFAQRAITAYRKGFAPMVPKVWYGLEDASACAVHERRACEIYGVTYKLEDGWLTARLPSGRRLWYYNPQPEMLQAPWNPAELKRGWSYWCWKGGKWIKRYAYGGLLTENVVQALARDLLVNAMFNCEAAAHPIILTVHDEVINEVPDYLADAKLLDELMTDMPSWARSIQVPLQTDCWTGERYKK